MHQKNKSAVDKVENIKLQQDDEFRSGQQQYQRNQNQLNSRLKALHKDLHVQWQQEKAKKHEIFEAQCSRKAEENADTSKKNQALMNKFTRSAKVVEEFHNNKKHELMLKQELRKLREEDMKKVQERQKRLEFKKKNDIMNKEVKDQSLIKEIKQRENALVNHRFQSLVNQNLERSLFSTSMDSWA